MWKLLRYEIEYFKWLYILSALFVFVVNMGITIDGRWIEAQDDFPGLRIIWIGVGIVVLFFAVLFNRKSGRLRNLRLVPLSDLQISFLRIAPFIIFWALLAVILVSFYFINFESFPNKVWLSNLVSITGIVLMINSIPIIYSDFYSTYFTKRDKIFLGLLWSVLWIIYISLNIIFMSSLDFIAPELISNYRQQLIQLYFTEETTIMNIAIGLSLFLSSIWTFKKRKLYLE